MKERQWEYLRVLPASTISSIQVNFAFKRRKDWESEKIRKVRNVFIDLLKCISKFSATGRNVGHCDNLNSIQWRKYNSPIQTLYHQCKILCSLYKFWKSGHSEFYDYRTCRNGNGNIIRELKLDINQIAFGQFIWHIVWFRWCHETDYQLFR